MLKCDYVAENNVFGGMGADAHASKYELLFDPAVGPILDLACIPIHIMPSCININYVFAAVPSYSCCKVTLSGLLKLYSLVIFRTGPSGPQVEGTISQRQLIKPMVIILPI